MPLRNRRSSGPQAEHQRVQRLTTLALLAAVALVLSWVDSLIPVSGLLPGAKLGLANLAVLSAFYLLGRRDAFLLAVLKVFLSTFLFGNAYSFWYAAAGGLLSYVVMALLYRRASVPFVSIIGGICHNIGQIAVAILVLQTPGLIGYLPVLLLCGMGAGAAVGALGSGVITRVRSALKKQTPGNSEEKERQDASNKQK